MSGIRDHLISIPPRGNAEQQVLGVSDHLISSLAIVILVMTLGNFITDPKSWFSFERELIITSSVGDIVPYPKYLARTQESMDTSQNNSPQCDVEKFPNNRVIYARMNV